MAPFYLPLKLFPPIAVLFLLLGTGYWVATYGVLLRTLIMTVFMLATAVAILRIGLVSEQITQRTYYQTIIPESRPMSDSTER